MVDEFPYDSFYTEKAVITGICALARNGLIYANAAHLELQTEYKNLDNLCTIACSFHFVHKIDWYYELEPSLSNPLLLLPSAERSLIECIAHIDWVDEGFLIEALQDYNSRFLPNNYKKLYACADHFGVPRETADYWINEALTDEEV